MPDTANKHFTTDRYLERLEAERIRCTIFLMNGFQMHSVRLIGHDSTSILMEVNGMQQVVFRQAISTFAPFCPVRLTAPVENRENDGERGGGHG